MSTQSYYLTEFENQSDIQNSTDAFCVNCSGIVDKDVFSTAFTRKDFYLMYLTQGSIESCIGTLKSGDAVIFPPQFAYSYKSLGRATYLWIHFSGSKAEEFLQKNLLPLKTIIRIGVQEILKSYFENMFFEFMLNDNGSEEMRICILKEILILIGRYQGDYKDSAPLKSISYINKNYTKSISIVELANLEEISLTAYRILFKKHTGTSPLQYINSRKLAAACRLLCESSMSVSAISSHLGFSDPYYFSRFFKKHMSVSPKYFQKKNKEKKM